MNIGLIGYGGVGKAFIRLLEEKHIHCSIKYILKSDGGVFNSKGLDINDVIKIEDNIKEHEEWMEGRNFENVIDEKIDFLVELTPTNMKTGEPALTYIKEALNRGINVVTGNKGPILINYLGLKELAKKNNVSLGIGCTTGGALPSITGGRVDCAGARIEEIQGVLNGTTNYILKEMGTKEIEYEEALKNAQELGIAETNPKMDVEGFDTAIKMIILTNALLGKKLTLEDAEIEGITKVTVKDIKEAEQEGKKIKLLGKVFTKKGNIKVKVTPVSIDEEHPLYFVEGKNKGIYYRTDTLGDITIIGGASSTRNAAAAILRDIENIKIMRV
ncbi:homoserine dehydrogenase [Clostridium vincentii]|uniref:Homoserine dehydrogenase n=1 Tax=Clostridium vincentii TaxID=52704 RepID=A0A2T0BFT4_9CLOT|nr:homoserine dehydrogenase [Clostridium vincentii]PRR82693.1 Homoserine dehydrogenase [Clostridium vincentii]